MEPDDQSFIEISGEDDSLLPLQQIANDDVSSLKNTYFACSPLQVPRSGCSVNPPFVSPIGSVNKENVSLNKPEVPKLNMEPQQMKRKKKGGGFNLRKSLAWNKAFFTEEGVLDPLELSMICSNSGKSSGELLSVIEEDGRESLDVNSKDLTVSSKNVFKELPAKNIREDRKSRGALSHKKGSPAGVKVAPASAVSGSPAGVNVPSASAGKRKVLSAHDINKSGSKRSGCPRPVASSSPANTKTVRSTTNESRVSREPARKLDTSVHSATARNIIPGTSNMKRNQISQPAVSIQRNIGSKVTSSSTKRAQSDARSGSNSRSITARSSVQQARRNLTNSEKENHSLAKSQHPLVSKTKTALKVDTAPLPTSANVSNNHGSDSRKVPISLPSPGGMQYAQIQTAKPSGLRMPSPSLGFFNQSNTSALPSLLRRNEQACNVLESNIPDFKRSGALNATQNRFMPATGMANGVATSNMRIPKSIKGSSIPTRLSTDLQEEVKSNLHINEIQKVELDGPFKCNNDEILNNQPKLHGLCNDIVQEALQNLGPSETEKISHMVNNELKNDDVTLLLHRGLSDQQENDEVDDKKIANVYPSMDLSGTELENPHFPSLLQPIVQDESVFSTKYRIDNQHVEEKMCNSLVNNQAATTELQSGDATSDTINATLKRKDDWLGSVHALNEQSWKQDQEMVPCLNRVSFEGQKPCLSNDALSKEIRSSDFHNCKTAKIADGSPEVRCCSGGAVEYSYGQPHSGDTVEAKDCAAGIGNICTKSQVGDVEVQSVDDTLSAGSIRVTLCSSPLDKRFVDMTDNVNNAHGSELKNSGALYSIPPATQDCGFQMAETAEFSNGDATISGFADAQLSHETKLHGLTTSGESEMIGKDQSVNAATTTIIEVPNVHLNSGLSSGCELDLQQFETLPSDPVQTENSAMVNDTFEAVEVKSYVIDDANEHKGVGKKLNLHCSSSDSQPADDISYRQHSTSAMHDDQMRDMPMVCQQSVEENQSPNASDKLVSKDDGGYCQHSTSMVHIDQLSPTHMFSRQSDGIQIQNVSDELLSDDCMPFEESREPYMEKVIDISLDVKSSRGSGPENPNNLFQHNHVEQGNEETALFDNTIKKPLVEDEKKQVLEGSLFAGSCNGNLNDMVVDEIPNSNVRDACGSLDAHGNSTVNSCSSEEYLDNNGFENLMDDTLEQSDACANESNSSIVCPQIASAVREGGIDDNQKAVEDDGQNIGINALKSDILPDEACISQNNGFSDCEIKHELENPVFATEDATMSSPGVAIQDIEVDLLKGDVLPEDAETSSIPQKNGNREMQCELENAKFRTEDQEAIELKKTENDNKQDNPVIKPPPNAVPFSDEWLAAFEAAGEEILTMKSGAVKHSPPDKSLPEPSPWSPVKRKNNQGIGPFDCTKFTNGNINAHASDTTCGD